MGNCVQTTPLPCCGESKAAEGEPTPHPEPDPLQTDIMIVLKDLEGLEDQIDARSDQSGRAADKQMGRGQRGNGAVTHKSNARNGKTLVQYENGGVYEGGRPVMLRGLG